MKILLLGPYWTPIYGGLHRYVSELRSGLLGLGIQVQVAAMLGEPEVGVEILPRSRFRAWLGTIAKIGREKPDVVHVHGHWLPLSAAIVARWWGWTKRVVFTFHSAITIRGLRGRIFRNLLNRCSLVTAVSSDLLARQSQRYELVAPVGVSYPGAHLPETQGEIKRKARERLGLPVDAQVIMAAAPFQYPYKVAGLLDLIRAFPGIHATHPTSRLAILGSGSLGGHIEEVVAASPAREHIHLLGSAPDAMAAFAAADIVCHISYQDELPHTLLEAMAWGKAIVCSPVGGVPELARDGREALHVQGGPEAIGIAVRRLLEDESLRRNLGEAAKGRIEESFTWSSATRHWLTLYGTAGSKQVHISVDVEEDYLLPGPSYRGVEEALPRLLDILDRRGVRASFFLTLDVRQRFPSLAAAIRKRGHHVGCHGVSHQAPSLAGRSVRDQTSDLRLALGSKEDFDLPLALRAPNFHADADTVLSLGASGVSVDSSVVPNRVVRSTRRKPRIDFRGAPAVAYRPSSRSIVRIGFSPLLELPVTANPDGSGSPLGLGFLQLAGVQRTLDALSRVGSDSVVFLIHPWEAIDYPSDFPVPSWMKKACKADLRALEAFLDSMTKNHVTVPLTALLASPLEANERWWSPGPWSSLIHRPRIVLVDGPSPASSGGITYVDRLRQGLIDRGFEVTLMSRPARRERDESSRWPSPVGSLLQAVFVLNCVGRVLALRLQRRQVIVHSHNSPSCLVAGYLSKMMGAISLHTFHFPVHRHSSVLEWMAPRVHALVYTSDSVRQIQETASRSYHERAVVAPDVTTEGSNGTDGDVLAEFHERMYQGLWKEEGVPKLFPIQRRVRDKGASKSPQSAPS